jgi:nitrogen fixation protein FixH
LEGAEIGGRFLRPADTRLDQEFQLAEVRPGVYQSILVMPAQGNWDLTLNIRSGEDRHELRASTTVAP